MYDPTIVEPTRLDWLSDRSSSNMSLSSLDLTIVESTRLDTPPTSPINHRKVEGDANGSNIIVKAMSPCQEVQQLTAHNAHNNHSVDKSRSCDLFASVFDSKTSKLTLDCKSYFAT
jgi:hypothetical protein